MPMTHATPLADEITAPDPWLWPERVALGSLTLLVGDPGIGKSYLTLDMAARVSHGALWPEDELAADSALKQALAPGTTFLLCAEDDYPNTIRPRLIALGADLSKVIALRDDRGHQAFDLLPYLPKFENLIQSTPNPRLWIIDPISSYLGSLKENHDRSVRGLLNPLANLAVAHHLAIVLVTHLSKGDGKALHRVLGSRAFGAAARNVWLVSKDPEDCQRRLLVSMKQNRTAPPTSLAFTIECGETSGHASIRWADKPVSVDADEALEATAYVSPPRNQLRRQVIDWLEETLADGPLPPDMVRELAEKRGFANTTLRRAFREMGGQSYWEKQGTSSVRMWRLGPDPNAV
jgi:putative DNA primase/helicase